jgi:hypothetical protein
VLISTRVSGELISYLSSGSDLMISPRRVALAGAFVAYAYGFGLHRSGLHALLGAGCLAGALGGHSVPAIAGAYWAAGRAIALGLKETIPTTRIQGGITAVVAAFVFLGMGAGVSLWKYRESKKERMLEESCRISRGPFE